MALVQGTNYSGQYGAAEDNADLVVIRVHVGPYNSDSGSLSTDNHDKKEDKNDTEFKNKEIFLLADVSGSMEREMINLKSSLLTFANTLLGITKAEADEMGPQKFDVLLRSKVRLSLITFHGTATHAWSSFSTSFEKTTFVQTVNDLKTGDYTNIGDAIVCAFGLASPIHSQWFILFTDGVPTCGPCRELSDFQRLIKKKPKYSCFLCLGYTTDYDPVILKALGDTTYIPSDKEIPVILASIAVEIKTTWGLEACIGMDRDEEEETEKKKIDEDKNATVPHRPVVIGGGHDVGTLFVDRKYMFGFLPFGLQTKRQDFKAKFHNRRAILTYFDVVKQKDSVFEFKCRHDAKNVLPEDIRSAYFVSEKGRYIKLLYKSLTEKSAPDPTLVSRIQKRIDQWKDIALAQPHYTEMVKVLANKSWSKVYERTMQNTSSDSSGQRSYGSSDFMTPLQAKSAHQAQKDAHEYTTFASKNFL